VLWCACQAKISIETVQDSLERVYSSLAVVVEINDAIEGEDAEELVDALERATAITGVDAALQEE
jgi:hypothetical protein